MQQQPKNQRTGMIAIGFTGLGIAGDLQKQGTQLIYSALPTLSRIWSITIRWRRICRPVTER